MIAEINEDRFSYLFDLASGNVSEVADELSAAEQSELSQIRALLNAIDNSWDAAPSELDQVRARFLEKLSQRDPNHPWVTESTVQTLGELIRVSGDDVPVLPEDVYVNLLQDATPVQELLDPERRTGVVGQAMRNARVPQAGIGAFMLWTNRTLSALFPLPGTAQPRYIFTRKQGSKRDVR